jgi:Ca-activated chloride channel homolog
MRKSILIIGLFLAIAAIAIVYATQSMTSKSTSLSIPLHRNHSNANVEFEWKLANPYMLRQAGSGDAYLDLRVTGKTLHGTKRKPLNLVLVIDRSGSMADENKLQQVKQAASAIIDQMNSTDRLGIVIYDDLVQTILPSTSVENPGRIRELLAGLAPGGSTNLCGGLQQGFEEVRRNFKPEFVNRVILLSDGLANVGVIDPQQIAGVAQQIRERSISVSTMGVGIDYNETLMASIADQSGGNYYYISRDINMAEIFRREWNLMQNLVATNVVASLDLNRGVQVQDVPGFVWSVNNRRLQIQIPDIYTSETKRILVHLHAPADTKTMVKLGNGQLTYTDVASQQPVQIAESFTPAIQVIDDQRVVASNFDRDVQAKVASVDASKKMEAAYRELEAGNQEVAYQMANDAAENLKALGYTQNEAQVKRYEALAGKLAAPTAPEERKDILKKQKAADRNAQQSVAQ